MHGFKKNAKRTWIIRDGTKWGLSRSGIPWVWRTVHRQRSNIPLQCHHTRTPRSRWSMRKTVSSSSTNSGWVFLLASIGTLRLSKDRAGRRRVRADQKHHGQKHKNTWIHHHCYFGFSRRKKPPEKVVHPPRVDNDITRMRDGQWWKALDEIMRNLAHASVLLKSDVETNCWHQFHHQFLTYLHRQ